MMIKTNRTIKLGARVILANTFEKAFLHASPLDMPDHYVVEIAASLDHRLVRRDEVKRVILRRIAKSFNRAALHNNVKSVYGSIERGNS